MTIPASPSSRPSICHVGAARAAALFLAFVSFSVGGLFVIYPWINSTVSDLPFFLSTGKYICEQGIPYTNPFAVDEGLGIVVQQWLWDVAVFKLHELGGYNLVAALGIALAACACALCLPVWQSVSGGEAVGKTQALPAGAAVACCLLFSLPWARGRRRAQESWGGGAPPPGPRGAVRRGHAPQSLRAGRNALCVSLRRRGELRGGHPGDAGPLVVRRRHGPWHACGLAACCAAPLAVGLARARRGKTKARLDLASFSLASAVMTLAHIRNAWICYLLGVPM